PPAGLLLPLLGLSLGEREGASHPSRHVACPVPSAPADPKEHSSDDDAEARNDSGGYPRTARLKLVQGSPTGMRDEQCQRDRGQETENEDEPTCDPHAAPSILQSRLGQPQVPRQDPAHDLAGPLADLQDLRVAVVASDRELLDEPVRPVDL